MPKTSRPRLTCETDLVCYIPAVLRDGIPSRPRPTIH